MLFSSKSLPFRGSRWRACPWRFAFGCRRDRVAGWTATFNQDGSAITAFQWCLRQDHRISAMLAVSGLAIIWFTTMWAQHDVFSLLV